jgi:antirestriction protein ArdC/phage/plasmid primase-like uncharacterized protein
MEAKKPFHEVVAEKLIEQLKAGTAPWQKPWEPGGTNAYLPMNPTTGKRYKGINAIHLMAQGHSDARWMTYKQAAAVGAQVRKGEKGTPVQYWKFSEEQDKLDDNGRPVLDSQGQPVKETVLLERPRVFFATVFNGQQIEGLPPLQPQKEQTWNAVERAEQILKASGATITHTPGDRAFYRPSSDSITLPERGQFTSADRYYATALHELGHWSGHASRLNRDLAHPFGSEGYAKEELRAEIASMIIGDELGIGHDPGQHAAYVGSWIKSLQDEPLEVFRAAADAEKIHDYVLAFEHKQVQEQTEQQGRPSEQPDQILPAEQEASMQPALQRAKGEMPNPPEAWTLDHLQRGTLMAALEGANREQIERVADVLGAMQPLNQQNEYWTRHELPRDVDTLQGQLLQASNWLEGRRLDAVLAEGWKSTPSTEAAKTERAYLQVPFREKDEAKALGARWDRQQQSWYVPGGKDTAPFNRWMPGADPVAPKDQPELPPSQVQPSPQAPQERIYLAVPYENRVEAKSAGALWDKAVKSWYAGPKADMERLQRWLPDQVPSQQGPAMTPIEEFAQAMRSAGLFAGKNAQGEHPIMDGMRHRVPVEGGKKGTLDGFYVGHLDGHPAGRIINNKTGADITWKSKGYALSEQDKARLQAESAEKLARRAAEHEHAQEVTAQRVLRQMADLVPIVEPTPYLQAKGIQAHAGVMTDREHQKTYIPAFDTDGKQWSMQYIQEDGTKRFAKDSRKEGCFHPVGGMEALAVAPVLLISEGYATAAQIAQAAGHATVAAFDSGNLEAVAKVLHARFPDKPVIIAGDDDRHLLMTHGSNPGREKAEAAARAVGGEAIFPIFAPTENSYPRELPAVTPDRYRTHLRAEQRLADAAAGTAVLPDGEADKLAASMLSSAQLAALSRMKTHTDFNDLAYRSELSQEGVKRQIGAAINQVQREERRLEQQEQQEHRREEKQPQQTEQRPRRALRIG